MDYPITIGTDPSYECYRNDLYEPATLHGCFPVISEIMFQWPHGFSINWLPINNSHYLHGQFASCMNGGE